MATTVLRIDGEKRLRRKMQRLPKAIRKELAALFRKTGSAIVKDIRGTLAKSSGSHKEGPKGHWSSPPGTPPNKITGDLMRSVTVEQRATIKEILMLVDVNEFYGFFLEFGTVNMAARPFMRPGFRRHSPNLTKKSRKIIKKVPSVVARGK